MAKRSRAATISERRTTGDESLKPQLIERKCRVCEWQASVIERPGHATDCPWCYGPTTIIQVLQDAVERRGAKNPPAAALGRLEGLKGGHARAAALPAQQRKAIASKA